MYFFLYKPSDVEKRADIHIIDTDSGNSILIGTITCPSVVLHKKYDKAGDVANHQNYIKTCHYRSFFKIDDPSKQHGLFFFAVESSGALSDESINFCKFLANISGKEISSTCQILYQRISCRLQAIRADQVTTTLQALSSTSPPIRLPFIPPSNLPLVNSFTTPIPLVPLDSG